MSTALGLGVVLATGILSMAPEATESTVTLDVDVSSLPADEITEALLDRIEAEGHETLEAGGITVAEEAGTRLTVKVTRFGEHDVHYRTTLILHEEGADFERTVDCELCRDAELVEQLGKEIARLSGRVLYGPEAEQDADTTPAEDGVAESEGTDRVEEKVEPPRSIGPLGMAGIGTLLGGAVSIAVGLPLALTPDRARVGDSGIEVRTTRPAGLTMIGVGGALIVTGAVLTTIDVVRRKRQRKISLVPAATRTQMTISMGVRF